MNQCYMLYTYGPTLLTYGLMLHTYASMLKDLANKTLKKRVTHNNFPVVLAQTIEYIF